MKREELIKRDAVEEAKAVNEIITTEGCDAEKVMKEYGGDTTSEIAEWLLNGDGELDKKTLTPEEVDDYLDAFWGEANIKFSKEIDAEMRKLLSQDD